MSWSILQVKFLIYLFRQFSTCVCGAVVKRVSDSKEGWWIESSHRIVFRFEVYLVHYFLLSTHQTLETFLFYFYCFNVREKKLKFSIFKIWIHSPPPRMMQSAPLQIDTFKWRMSQVGFRTENFQIGNSDKQICKCPPCNIQILIFAFQNFFECRPGSFIYSVPIWSICISKTS